MVSTPFYVAFSQFILSMLQVELKSRYWPVISKAVRDGGLEYSFKLRDISSPIYPITISSDLPFAWRTLLPPSLSHRLLLRCSNNDQRTIWFMLIAMTITSPRNTSATDSVEGSPRRLRPSILLNTWFGWPQTRQAAFTLHSLFFGPHLSLRFIPLWTASPITAVSSAITHKILSNASLIFAKELYSSTADPMRSYVSIVGGLGRARLRTSPRLAPDARRWLWNERIKREKDPPESVDYVPTWCSTEKSTPEER